MNGWCKSTAHGPFDHALNDNCVDPVTEAQALAEIEATTTTYSPEAAYVAEHRPY